MFDLFQFSAVCVHNPPFVFTARGWQEASFLKYIGSVDRGQGVYLNSQADGGVLQCYKTRGTFTFHSSVEISHIWLLPGLVHPSPCPCCMQTEDGLIPTLSRSVPSGLAPTHICTVFSPCPPFPE